MNDVNQLLKQYAAEGSEPAFRELVTRYVGLVYSVALRRMRGDTHRAEEVTQVVFTDLAQKAATLPERVMLGGWLHRHTGFVASNYVRGEIRRQVREKEAATMMLHESEETNWQEVAPLLDEAIDQLDGTDREAILLRYFEKRDLRSLGAYFGIGEDAAQKRVSRAVDKLRDLLAERGVALTGLLLGTLLTERAVQAGPAGLAEATSNKVLKSLLPASVAAGILGLLSWGALKGLVAVLLISAVIAVAVWPKANVSELKISTGKVRKTTLARVETKQPGPSELAQAREATPVEAPVNLTNANYLHLKLVAMATGQPVSGANVHMLRWDGKKYVTGDFPSDANGNVEVPVVKGELARMELTTQVDGFADTHLQWSAQQGNALPESFTAKLDPAVAISGRVVDAEGNPVAGAKVGFNHESNPLLHGVVQTHEFGWIEVVTDGEGRWNINRIAAAMVREIYGSARHTSYVDAPMKHVSQVQGMAEELKQGTHVFRLGRAVVARGVVVDPDGKPVAGAKILVGMRSSSGSRKAVTNTAGQFEVLGCKPGKNLLTAEAEGFSAVTEEVDFVEGATPYRLVLQEGKILKLRVVNKEGKPLPKASVVLDIFGDRRVGDTKPKPVQVEFNPKTDTEGRIVWSQAPDRELALHVYAPGYMRFRDFKVRPDGQEHELVLPPAVIIEGTVKDAESGEPIPKFRIVTGYPKKDVFGGKSYVPSWSSLDRFWLSFGGGKYKYTFEEPVVVGIANPGYLFKFEAEGYTPYESGIVPADAGTVRMDVTLRRTQNHAVMVKLPNGQPAVDTEVGVVLPGANLQLVPGGFGVPLGNRNYTAIVRTDRAGIFKMLADETVQRVVVANEMGYGEETLTTLLNSPTLQIYPWGRVEGVYISNGKPMSEVELRLDFLQSRVDTLRLDYQTKTDTSGKFSFNKVPFGQLQLIHIVPTDNPPRVGFNTYAPMQRLEVRSGETTFVNLGGNSYQVKGRIEWPEGYEGERRGGLGLTLLAPGTSVESAYRSVYQAGMTILKAEPDGTWSGNDLKPGRYTLLFRGYVVASVNPAKLPVVWATKEIDLPESSSVGPIDFGSVELKIKE